MKVRSHLQISHNLERAATTGGLSLPANEKKTPPTSAVNLKFIIILINDKLFIYLFEILSYFPS